MIKIIMIGLLVTNAIYVYKVNNILDRVEDTMIDIDILYTKLQQFFREH